MKDDIVELVNSSGLKNARIKIMGQISLQDVIDALNPSVAYKKAIIIATKGDSENSKLNYNKLIETFGAPLDKDVVPANSKSPPKFHIFPVSIVYENGWERRKEIMPLGELVQKELKFIRIFTKARNGEVAPRPIIFLKNKVSVEDVALKIHKQMLKHFRYANVYREGS
ncbi:MAG: TGS domain-containing protein, partial [Promethearchaeota archaeon]